MVNLVSRPIDEANQCLPAEIVQNYNLELGAFFKITSGVAVLPMKIWKLWHPCDILPSWLEHYNSYHFANQTVPLQPSETTAVFAPNTPHDTPSLALQKVHRLYHQTFESDKDRVDCATAIDVCHTVAVIFDPPATHLVDLGDDIKQGGSAVAALSFIVFENTVFIIYLAVDQKFRDGGFGTLLLILAGKYAQETTNSSRLNMILLANQDANPASIEFYSRRGFSIKKPPADKVTLPKPVRHLRAVTNKFDTFLLVTPEVEDTVDAIKEQDEEQNDLPDSSLVWLYLANFRKMKIEKAQSATFSLMNPAFNHQSYGRSVKAAPPPEQQFMNDDACYCEYPSWKMTYNDAAECVKGL